MPEVEMTEIPASLRGFARPKAAEILKDKSIAAGLIVPVICTNIKKQVSQTKKSKNNFQFILEWTLLEDSDDLSSTTKGKIREWVSLPMKNPTVEKHDAPSGKGFAALMHILFPNDVPDTPRGKGGEYEFMGKIIKGQTAYDKAAAQAVKIALDKAMDVWDDPSEGEGAVAVARTVHSEGGKFTNIRYLTTELKDEEEFSDPDEYFVAVEDEDDDDDDDEEAVAAPVKKTRKRK